MTEEPTKPKGFPTPLVQSFILADHVYQDVSGKKIIAGTFNMLVSEAFGPDRVMNKPVFAYLAITGCHGTLQVQLRYVDLKDDSVLLQSGIIPVEAGDPLATYEVIMEVPPLPLPHPGQYSFEAYCNGERIGGLKVAVFEKKEG